MKFLIIGATGSIGQVTRNTLLETTSADLVLYSRRAGSLKLDMNREEAINGDAKNMTELTTAMHGVNAVFAALSGNLTKMAQAITVAMKGANINRLVFISSMGIYDEIPARVGVSGNLSQNPILRPYREAADIIEATDLNYTIIRPGWFDNGSTDYEVTRKGEPFGGHDVSRQAIADLAGKLLTDPNLYSRDSIGINRPER